MLEIDLKKSNLNPQKAPANTLFPSGQSLNRAVRVRELTRVTQENKALLKRL